LRKSLVAGAQGPQSTIETSQFLIYFTVAFGLRVVMGLVGTAGRALDRRRVCGRVLASRAFEGGRFTLRIGLKFGLRQTNP